MTGAPPKPDLGSRSSEWPRVRAAHLKKQPVCQACGGTTNLEVHHKQPFHLFPTLELDDTNLITLCELTGHDCHFVFGHFHDWKNWNPAVEADVTQYNAQRLTSPALNAV